MYDQTISNHVQEIAASQSSAQKQLLSGFWNLPGSIPGRPQLLHLATTASAAVAASRYQTDFLETARLGKGGYGVVAAAMNR